MPVSNTPHCLQSADPVDLSHPMLERDIKYPQSSSVILSQNPSRYGTLSETMRPMLFMHMPCFTMRQMHHLRTSNSLDMYTHSAILFRRGQRRHKHRVVHMASQLSPEEIKIAGKEQELKEQMKLLNEEKIRLEEKERGLEEEKESAFKEPSGSIW